MHVAGGVGGSGSRSRRGEPRAVRPGAGDATNQAFARRHNTAHDYLLRAQVGCGTCGLACVGRTHQPGYSDYLCHGKANPVASCRDEKCPARFIPSRQLDALVWQDLCELLTHPESIAQAMERAQGGHWLPQALQARRENLRRGRVSLEQQLERLTEAYPRQRDPAARVSAPTPRARSEGLRPWRSRLSSWKPGWTIRLSLQAGSAR